MKKTVRDIDFKNKRALVRVDFNVPMKDGKITDDFRIKSALKTIDYLMDQGAKVILMSHLGRPKDTYKPEFSLKPVAEKLEELTGKKVVFFDIESPVNEDTLKASKDFDGSILLLQNTRYDAGEEKNDPELAKKFAEHGDIYVNDAFGTAHRAHASNVGVSQILPAVAGFLVENEIKYIKENLDNPKHPFVAILGGAKVSDKIGVIENLMNKVDKIIIGGAMANTFLKAQGYDMGKSLVEDEKIGLAKDLLKESADKNVEILLPLDLVMTDSLDDSKVIKTLKLDDDKADLMAVDIGEKTIKIFSQAIGDAKLVIWNGPMGVFENKDFAKGTFEIARAVAENSGVSIIGGGDSSLAVKLSGYEDKVTHVSTGGGASLEMMEGKELPGIKCLEEA